MMKRLLSIYSLLFLLFPFSLHAYSNETQFLINDCNKTGIFLFYILEKTPNPVISPFSIYTSLLMTYAGARGNTATQIEKVLGFKMSQKEVTLTYNKLYGYLTEGIQDRDFVFSIGNGIWIDSKTSIFPDFRDTIEDDFNGTVQPVNFRKTRDTLKKINQWVEKKTHKKITNFLLPSDLSTSTKMILANTLFLQGTWKNPFQTQKTGIQDFLATNNERVKAQMMNQVSSLPYYENSKTQVLALPIETDGNTVQYALVIFLPKKSTSSLFDFYYQQDEEAPEGFLSYLDRLKPQNIDLTLPKFNFNQKLNLGTAFQTMGITDAFSTQADFSGINGKKDLLISKALHQCTISVDEGGIFSGAASSISFDLKSALDLVEPTKFFANHPFLFALVEMDSKLILFLGECIKPVTALRETKKGEKM